MTTHTIETVESEIRDGVNHYTRECLCGWVTIAEDPEPDFHTPLARREADHLTEADKIADGSVWNEIPTHREYRLVLRHRRDGKTKNDVAIIAYWTGDLQVVLIWPWNVEGLTAAQQWCDEHYTTIHHTGWLDRTEQVLPNTLVAQYA